MLPGLRETLQTIPSPIPGRQAAFRSNQSNRSSCAGEPGVFRLGLSQGRAGGPPPPALAEDVGLTRLGGPSDKYTNV